MPQNTMTDNLHTIGFGFQNQRTAVIIQPLDVGYIDEL
jgi:hypothetical protein